MFDTIVKKFNTVFFVVTTLTANAKPRPRNLDKRMQVNSQYKYYFILPKKCREGHIHCKMLIFQRNFQ